MCVFLFIYCLFICLFFFPWCQYKEENDCRNKWILAFDAKELQSANIKNNSLSYFETFHSLVVAEYGFKYIWVLCSAGNVQYYVQKN